VALPLTPVLHDSIDPIAWTQVPIHSIY
jgi:hypothetical protein